MNYLSSCWSEKLEKDDKYFKSFLLTMYVEKFLLHVEFISVVNYHRRENTEIW